MLALLLSVVVAHSADCPEPVQAAELGAFLQAADTRYVDLDIDGFVQLMTRVESLLPCVTDTIEPALAADLHRHQGLVAFIDRKSVHAKAAFASARAIEPDYVFPAEMVPPDNPVLLEYKALDPAETPVEQLSEPAEGWIHLDGTRSFERSTARPVVFQHLLDDGVQATAYLWPGEKPPPYVARPVAEAAPAVPQTPQRAGAKGARRALTGVAIATGSVAAAAWGASVGSRNQYDQAASAPDLERYRARTNTLALTSAGAAVVATGAGAAAVFVGRF